MDIGLVDSGCPLTLVAKVEVFDCGLERHLLCMAYSGGFMVYRGLLDGGTDMVTLVDALVEAQFLIPVLEQGKDTKVQYHSTHSWNDYFRLVDVCCGIGGVAHGALDVGVQTTVSNDCNTKMLELHRAHSGAHCTLGDWGNPPSWCGRPQPKFEVLPTDGSHGKLMDKSRIDAGCPMTHGALAVGALTMVAYDCKVQLMGLHKAHSGYDLVSGEAGNSQVVAEIWRHSDRAAIGSAECSCQICPFGCCDVIPSDQWCHGNGSDGLLAASSNVVLSTQCRQNGLPSEELALNGHGGLGTSLHVCGRGEAMTMVVEQIRLPMAMYTILGFCAALMQCHVMVAGKVRLLTHLLFLSASRIRVACHPGPDRGGPKCVAAFLAGLCCLATFVIDHVTGAGLWALCEMCRWLLLFCFVPFWQLLLPWDGLLVSVPVTGQSQP